MTGKRGAHPGNRPSVRPSSITGVPRGETEEEEEKEEEEGEDCEWIRFSFYLRAEIVTSPCENDCSS